MGVRIRYGLSNSECEQREKNAQKEEMYVNLLCARDDKLLCVDIVQHTIVNVQKSGYIKVSYLFM